MTKGELMGVIVNAIPYPNQIKEIDLDSEKEAIRFSWRSGRYRVTFTGHVEEVGEGVLIGSDITILMRKLIRLTITEATT